MDKIQRRVYCVVSYPEVATLDGTLRGQIRAAVFSEIPRGFRCEVQFSNDKFTVRSFVALISDYTKKHFPLFADIRQDKISATVSDNFAKATFWVNKFTKHNMELAEYTAKLSEFFATYSSYETEFFVEEDKNAVEDVNVLNQERLVHLSINRELLKPQRYFNVSDVQKQIGKEIVAKPMYISDIRGPMESCVICGVISEKELRAVKNNAILKLCKFNLTDGSGATMPCLMFVRFNIEDTETIKQTTGKTDSEVKTISEKQRAANDTRMKKLAFLTDGSEVVVRGKVVFSKFSERLELQMYDISKCRIQPIRLQPVFKSGVPAEYVLVRPQPMEEYRQLSLTNMEEKSSVLTGKNCVVLYANLTGYNVVKDKIFALCGVRLVDGHPKEKFFTYVSPETDLSDEQLAEIGVTPKQLLLSPTLTEIVADLYKFVDQSILVGEKIPELLELLNYYGAPLGYNFANETEITTNVLQNLFENSSLDVGLNFSRIDEVAKALRLDCRISANCRDIALCVAECMASLVSHAK